MLIFHVYDQMLVDLNADDVCRLDDLPGNIQIVLGRSKISRRVIVANDQLGCPLVKMSFWITACAFELLMQAFPNVTVASFTRHTRYTEMLADWFEGVLKSSCYAV